MDTPKEVELYESFAVIRLPSDSVEVEINVKVYHDGELINVAKTLTMEDIREVFNDAEENYFPDDAKFVITDEGRKYLEGYKF